MPRKRSTWGTNAPAARKGHRRLRYWADEHDGRGYARHTKTIRGTRRDGDEELARLRMEHAADAPVPTLERAWRMWALPDYERRVASGKASPNTLAAYQSAWRNHVAPAFGALPVTDIRPLDVQRWLSSMSKGAANLARAVLTVTLDKCVIYDVVQTNVARVAYETPTECEARSTDVYDLKSLRRALDAVRGTPAYVPAVLMGVASCRVGEALGALRSDVSEMDVDGATVAVVDIHQQATRDGRIMDRTKTRDSARPVIVAGPWAADVLAVAKDPGLPYLCDRGDGTPLRSAYVRHEWSRALAAAGIEPIPLRNLRASWRTICRWEFHVPADYVERMMGHAGRNVGEVHYDRPRAEAFAAVAARTWGGIR